MRDAIRGILWATVAVDAILSAGYTIMRWTSSDPEFKAHCRLEGDHLIIGAISTMVLFLCVPRSPAYVAPSKNETKAWDK